MQTQTANTHPAIRRAALRMMGHETSPRIALSLYTLRPDQQAIADDPAKIKVLAMGRRWGKTVLGGNLSLEPASHGQRVAWVVPTYKNGRALWRWTENVTAQARKLKLCTTNRSERTIEFINGGFLGIYSADSEDSIRSEAFHRVIVDEAARIPESAWTDAIYPTLADYNGDALLISSPNRKNWFYYEWLKGKSGIEGYAAFTAPSSANPNPNIQRAAELAKDRVSEDTYRQEWLAEFLENGGEVFRKVRDAIAPLPAEPYAGDFVAGVDWAMQTDYTVITVMDRATRKVVDIDRFNRVDWALQRQRVVAMRDKWKPRYICCEINSIGSPNFEALQREGLPVYAFETTASSKPPLIESLVLAFERGEIGIPDNAILIGELEAYERKVSPTTGRSAYSAPDGMHDDCVMSLALAWDMVVNYRSTGGIW